MPLLPDFLRRLAGGAPSGPGDPVQRPPTVPPREAVKEPALACRPAPAATAPVPSADARVAAVLAGAVTPYKRFPQLPGSDRRALAEAGRTVRARLDADPRARKLPALHLDMYVVADFLSADECAALVRLVDADVKPSTLLTGGANSGLRTSQTCRLPSSAPLVAEVERRMVETLGLPLSHSETVQGQRYAVGQQFRMHNDYFAGGQAYSETVASEGGQRTWTAMVFLNAPEAGGCTNFPRAAVKIAPAVGTLLAWNNNDRDGLSNPWSHHEGMPVEAGVKYILTKWFRERTWQTSAASDALRV